jgi:hypothetical protein
MKFLFCFLAFLFVNTHLVYAEATCRSAPEFRQFDFWIGEWNVHANGKLAGTSSIQLILDDCVIFENYTGVKGYQGKSFNVYNPAIKKWQQLWVDNSGGVLQLTGSYSENKMEYWGETVQAKGPMIKERLTFYRTSKEEVRQVWEQSQDQGKTWKTVFDGIYTRK